jgi:hypothetical protein
MAGTMLGGTQMSRVYYNGDYEPLFKTVDTFARKMAHELGVDLGLNKVSRGVIYSHTFNCLWEPLIKEIRKDQRRKKKLKFTRHLLKRRPHHDPTQTNPMRVRL